MYGKTSLNAGALAPKTMFKNFLIMWLGIITLTALIAVIFMPRTAKADILMPIIGLTKVSNPAEITSFTNQSSPAIVEERCQSLLSPRLGLTKHNASSKTSISRNWRNASTGEGQKTAQKFDAVEAIKAYRQCARTVALEELAKN